MGKRNPNSAPISEWAKKGIDKVITSEPRPYRAILDDLFILKTIEYHARPYKRAVSPPSRCRDMPTKLQLQYYLAKNYSTVNISNLTNKPVKSYDNSTPHYFKEE